MSDPKRATLITVGATKSEKNSVCKTVRLTINLDESNESKYPELNYKELVIAEDKKKRVENGKTKLDSFSDNDEEMERVAKRFEQKYGGKSTYGRKGRSKHDDFADIGAGYDENDPFIDNTDNYDEMMPPETDTFYGGFYINSGSLEFKSVPENRISDVENGRRNKRRLSSSSSEEESSDSSSESGSSEEKETKTIPNGEVHSDHRKKKSKGIDKKKKAKKIKRTDSSAATSGKQTSDDNGHGDAESADSRTSQSDSLTSKPAPSSENAVTSDSSRDAEAKSEVKLPQNIVQVLEELEAAVSKHSTEHPNTPVAQLIISHEKQLLSLESALTSGAATARTRRGAYTRAARALNTTRVKLVHRVQAFIKAQADNKVPPSIAQPATAAPSASNKRKHEETDEEINRLTAEEREAKIVETLQRLKALIDERTPAMMASYQAECDRVMEERKKLQIGSDGRAVEKRLPKRRFPWCGRARALLARLARLAAAGPAAPAGPPAPAPAGPAAPGAAAADVLARRALPLFPAGFVRMPTLLRQADLSKAMKASDVKRPRSSSQSATIPPPAVPAPPTTPTQAPATPTHAPTTPTALPEAIHFPSSLTVTTSLKTEEDKEKTTSIFGTLVNTFSLSKDLIVETEKKEPVQEKKEISNNIGSLTITPVINQKEKKPNSVTTDKMKEPLLRIKSPAVLNEMAKKEKHKQKDKTQVVKDKRVDSPLHVDTSYQPNKKEPTPSPNKDELTKKQIENMRVSENNIPRPALVPVHHSPTFAKPDKRPPEVKKKKEIVIVSDLDPLEEVPDPVVAVDDSSSDVEVIEDSKDKSDSVKCDTVPSKDKSDIKKDVKLSRPNERVKETANHRREKDDGLEDDIHTVMRNLREMEHSQETPKFNNSFGGVITSAKHEKSSKTPFNPRNAIFGDRSDKDKFAEPTSLNKMDGCSAVTG